MKTPFKLSRFLFLHWCTKAVPRNHFDGRMRLMPWCFSCLSMWIPLSVTEASFGSANSGGEGMKVAKITLIQNLTINGSVRPARKTLVTAAYHGYIRKLYVKIGDKVKPGDPIASVAASLTSLETVFPLRSPLAGKVVDVMKAEGEFVKDSGPTDSIARIDDLSHLFMDATIPEINRPKVRVGQEAILRVSAIPNRTYKGVVRDITLASRDANRWQQSTSVEFKATLEFEKFDDEVLPGMSALADIIALKKENVLALRHEFIERDKDRTSVTMKNGEKRSVSLGAQNEELAEIVDGLKEGDEVRKVDFAKLIDK